MHLTSSSQMAYFLIFVNVLSIFSEYIWYVKPFLREVKCNYRSNNCNSDGNGSGYDGAQRGGGVSSFWLIGVGNGRPRWGEAVLIVTEIVALKLMQWEYRAVRKAHRTLQIILDFFHFFTPTAQATHSVLHTTVTKRHAFFKTLTQNKSEVLALSRFV